MIVVLILNWIIIFYKILNWIIMSEFKNKENLSKSSCLIKKCQIKNVNYIIFNYKLTAAIIAKSTFIEHNLAK